MDPFLTLLHSFSLSLSDAELTSMKFLCRDKIGKRKLESVKSGAELFNILIEQQQITRDKVSFLESMLENIKREDLVARLKQFVEEGEVTSPDDQPDPREKRLLKAAIGVICDNVARNWKTLMRELDFPEVKLERVMAANPFNLREQFFQSLQEWQKSKGKDAKATDLIKALRRCNMNLVADKVEQKLLLLDTETR
ncbi:FAS-associated death domain protein [Colius striatus]|uniref:FAS-associated death domain protein n=1 Tax=Colius striatus TaxID=57412 RepID=UPI000529A1B5|nr:FAS-associated death domain protein [Colius striatus]